MSQTRDERVAIGAYLRRCRKEAGLGPQFLASLIGVSKQTLQNYEQGVTRVKPGTLAAIANVLEIDCDKFFADVAAVRFQDLAQ